MKGSYLWNVGGKISEIRLIIEGAVTLYEEDASGINKMMMDAGNLIAAAGFSVVVLSLVDKTASGLGMIHWKGVILAAVLLVLTRKIKQTKDLHPVVFIALSALVGALFGFAGV